MSDQVAQKCKLSQTPNSLTESTVGGTQVVVSSWMSLELVSPYNDGSFKPADAHTLADLPIQTPKSADSILSE